MFNNKFRWAIVIWFFIIYLVSFFDRVNLAMAAPIVMKEFGMSPSQLGLILGTFTLGYAFSNFPAGFLSQKYSSRVVISSILFLWSIMTLFTGFAWGFVSLLIFRAIFGVAEGPIVPVINGTVGRWLLSREKAMATGLWMAGIPAGVVLGNIGSVYIIEWWGWRSVFYIFGIGGILLAIATWYVIRDEPRQHPLMKAEEKDLIVSDYPALVTGSESGSTLRQLIKDRFLWVNCAANFFLALVFWANLNWLPTYFVIARKTTLLKSGALASLPWLIALIGMIVFGILSDKVGKGYKCNWLTGVFLASVPFTAYGCIAESVTVSLFCFSMSTLCIVGATILLVAMYHEIWDRADVAKVHGISTTFYSLAGFVSPYVVGYILEKTGSFEWAWYIFAFCGVIGAALFYIMHGREKHVREIRLSLAAKVSVANAA